MAIKELMHDEIFLSIPAQPATAEDAQVAQDLLDTLESIREECVGLAANMIGVAKAIIVFVDQKDKYHVMYNPVIKAAMRPFKTTEGCMSLERDTQVTRYATIRVEYDELVDGKLVHKKGQFKDWTAQIIQHEVDHCKGRLV